MASAAQQRMEAELSLSRAETQRARESSGVCSETLAEMRAAGPSGDGGNGSSEGAEAMAEFQRLHALLSARDVELAELQGQLVVGKAVERTCLLLTEKAAADIAAREGAVGAAQARSRELEGVVAEMRRAERAMAAEAAAELRALQQQIGEKDRVRGRGECEGEGRVWREFRRSDGVRGTAWGLGLDRQRGQGRGRKKAFPPS